MIYRLHDGYREEERSKSTSTLNETVASMADGLNSLGVMVEETDTFFGREEKEGNITQQKAMKKKREEVSDGKTIALAVGVCQLLDSYAAASLSAQHLKFFPTSVLQGMTDLKEKLQIWKESESDELFHSPIGSPKNIIENLKSRKLFEIYPESLKST